MRANRGAARVSLIWLIVTLVFAFVAIFFGYVSQDDLSKEKARVAEADAKRVAAEAKLLEMDDKRRASSELLGFFDPNDLARTVNVDLAKTGLTELRSVFPELPADVKNFQAALPAIAAERTKLVDQIDQLRNELAGLKSELETERSARSRDLAEKDKSLADLRNQLRDEQANGEERASELQDRLAAAEAQNNELDQELRGVRRSLEELGRDKDREIAYLQATLKSANGKLGFLKGEAAETADARVLSVSKNLPIGWIDVGSTQRLTEGLRFTIRSGGGLSKHIKGQALVVQVEAGMAKIEITELTDSFDPIVPGDVLFNTLFDPSGPRNAVLAGRFAGALSEAELRLVLANMGITVQDRLDQNTNLLILGGDLFTDAEGEPLEEPLKPSQLPVYSEAEAQGVAIVSYNELRNAFKF